MGFGIDRRARSTKGRGWFRKAPATKDVGERLGWLARRLAKGAVVRSGWNDDRFVVVLALHEAAPHATLTVEPDGELVVRAETAAIGPGYHASVLAKLAPILDELEYAWADEAETSVVQIQSEICAWLAGELRGADPVRFGVDRNVRSDAPVLTPLGPRDAAWRDAVLADPLAARDAFAWWADDVTGEPERARALLAMWREVAWREPLGEAEDALLANIDRDLRAAHAAGLALPWADWAQLLDLMGKDDELAAEVRERAGDQPPTIGYRRLDAEAELTGGWTVTLPGAFVGGFDDDGTKYWATDGDRAVEFSSLTSDNGSDSDALLAIAEERHPVIARLGEGDRRGRAEAYVTEEGVRVVIGLVACAPEVGIVTCKSTTADDDWALKVWRSLRV